MKYLYVLIKNESYEEMSIFIDKESAIKASKIFKNARVEIFKISSSEYDFEYKPIYSYYKNGKIEED